MAKNNPWLALSTYEEKDKDKFKGREQDTQNMLKMLQQNEYVVCYAASGDGKSSLINAGVCPGMRSVGYYPIKIVFSSDEYEGINIPQKEDGKIDFDACILRKIEETIGQIDFEVDDQFSNVPSSLSSILWWKLRTQTIQIPYGEFDYIPVLIFDQFEEILRAKWKNEFFSWLEVLSSDECPDFLYDSVSDYETLPSNKKYKAIFSMRYEYVGELDYWCSQRCFIPQMMRGRYFLKPLSKNQALEIIKEQDIDDNIKEKFNHEAENILDNINNNSNSDFEDEFPAVILSLICHILFNKWTVEPTYRIDSISINSVIYEYYREELNSIGLSDSVRRTIEDTLISSNGNRLRIHISDNRLKSINFSEYINKDTSSNLLSAHIVKLNDDYVEFAHDRLAEAILINKKEEDKKLNGISRYAFIRNAILFLVFCSSLFLCFYYGNKLRFHESQENSSKQTVVRDSMANNNDIIISDINDDLSKYDWANATSVSFTKDIHNCLRDGIYCYGNVVWLNNQFHYAENAKCIVFAQKYYRYAFNKNVEKVYLFYPEAVLSITCLNPETIFYIPFGATRYCQHNEAFDKVHFVEMDVIETLWEKTKYEFSISHIHLLDTSATINTFYVAIALFLMLIVWLVKNRKANMQIKSFVTFIIFYSVLTLLFVIIYFELYWIYQFKYFNIAIPLLGIVIIELLRYYGDRKYELYKDKAKICIVYFSPEGKHAARQLKTKLIENTAFNDSDIKLDLTIYHNTKFVEEKFVASVSSVKKTIAVITKYDIMDEKSEEYSKLLGTCHYVLPVLYDMDETHDVGLYGKYVSKTAKKKVYPAVFCARNFDIKQLRTLHGLLLGKPQYNKWILIILALLVEFGTAMFLICNVRLIGGSLFLLCMSCLSVGLFFTIKFCFSHLLIFLRTKISRLIKRRK